MTTNSVNNRIYSYRGFYIPNAKFVSVHQGSATPGTYNVYTCPAGKRAYVHSFYGYNAGPGNNSNFTSVVIGGVSYRIAGRAILQATFATQQVGFVLEAGQILQFNSVNVGTQANYFYRITEFDDNYPFYTAKILTLSSGNNTLYTVPAGKQAQILSGGDDALSGQSGMIIYNNSAGSVNYTVYLVKNGDVPNANNQFAPVSTVTAGNNTRITANAFFNSGDSIVVNSNSAAAGQSAFVTVYEQDNLP